MTGQLQRLTRKRVLESFPSLSFCNHDGYLALVKYLDGTPERFYSRESFRTYSDVLEKEYSANPTRLKKVLNICTDDIDRALLMLNEIGREDWHDMSIENDEYVFMRLLDRTLHPAYLKLAEGVLHRLINPIASCLRLDRGKKVDDLWKLSACITELTRGLLPPLVAHCDSVVRNSIAHGRITYRQSEVVYFDHKGNSRELTNTAVIELIDGLVDTCHGCVLALQLFYRKHLGSKIQVPRQVMLEELQEDSRTPWWNVEGCLVSKLATESQLVIYARPRSKDYFKVQYMCFYSAIMAEYFAPGFDRYFISLRSPMSLPGWAVFNGRKMREVRAGGGPVALENYKGALIGECVFYVPNIRLPWPATTIFTSQRQLHLPIH